MDMSELGQAWSLSKNDELDKEMFRYAWKKVWQRFVYLIKWTPEIKINVEERNEDMIKPVSRMKC